jgi:outer membrane lipoprotein carrier protein
MEPSGVTLKVALAVLALAGATAATALDLEEVIDRVQDRYEETEFLQARFRQVSTLKSIGESQSAEGRVFIRKPGRMRWEYEKPEPQILISDGENFWVYTPNQNQVIVTKAGEGIPVRAPTAFLAGKGRLRSEFEIAWSRDLSPPKDPSAETYRLDLSPRTPHPSLERLVIEVRADDFNIVRSSVVDVFGNVTDVEFSEIVTDRPLLDDLFTFEIPHGVEILRPPRLPTGR